MFFSRAFSLFFVLALALIAFANPVAKRQEDLITDSLNSAITTLQGLQGTVNADNIASVIPSITTALQNANSQISALNSNEINAKRDLLGDVVALVGEIVEDVAHLLDGFVTPAVDDLVIVLDEALNGLVLTVNGLIPGLLAALNTLLAGVAGLLQSLGLQLILTSLSL